MAAASGFWRRRLREPAGTPPPMAVCETRPIEAEELRRQAVTTGHPGFWGGQLLRCVLAPAAQVPLALPLIAGTEAFAEDWLPGWHRRQVASAHDVACYFATDVVLSGSGQVALGDRVVVADELMPVYVRRDLPAAALLGGAPPTRSLARPCVVMQGGLNIYGHFLIETLLQVLVVRRLLSGNGLRYAWLLPRTAADWLLAVLRQDLGVAPDDIEFYDPATERVLLRQAILPADVHREDGFHPIAGELLDELVAALVPWVSADAAPTRLFLVRGEYANRPSAHRVCVNEPALLAFAARRHGFRAVAMETLAWREQIALLRGAELILGQFGSALHGALFSPPGTRVAVMGRLNLVQSHIGALRRHRLAYLTRDVVPEGRFAIDEAAFRSFLDAVCAAG